MYPRLKLLHRLLSDDGAIFISIDDNEQANLKLICDEIFGNENFVTQIAWQNLDTIKNDAKYFSDNHEYIISFAKNIKLLRIQGLKKGEKQRAYYKNYDNDPRGNYLLTPLHAKSGSESGRYSYTFSNGQTWQAPPGTYPRYSRETLSSLEKENRLFLDPKGMKVPQKKTFLSEVGDRMPPTTFWGYDVFGSTRQSNKELSKILGKGAFQNPKPSTTIQALLDLIDDNSDSIILDSFAGSGTTAHAVLNLNKKDGGNRKFILIELEDYAESITAERVKRVIDGYGEGKNQVEGTGGGFTFYELGDVLLNEDGTLNESQPVEAIREYIWYSETKSALPDKHSENSHPHYLGTRGRTDYYFFYDKEKVTVLDHDFLRTISSQADGWVIYADICTLSEAQLDEYRITFKKIPRDIRRY